MNDKFSSAKKILLVDDIQINLTLLEKVLLMGGFASSSALSGEEALKKIKDEIFDGMIIDIQMSGMNGIELTQVIREDEKITDIPIMLITAHQVTPELLDKIGNLKIFDFIQKPFNIKWLIKKVEMMIDFKNGHNCEYCNSIISRIDTKVKELSTSIEYILYEVDNSIVPDEEIVSNTLSQFKEIIEDIKEISYKNNLHLGSKI